MSNERKPARFCLKKWCYVWFTLYCGRLLWPISPIFNKNLLGETSNVFMKVIYDTFTFTTRTYTRQTHRRTGRLFNPVGLSPRLGISIPGYMWTLKLSFGCCKRYDIGGGYKNFRKSIQFHSFYFVLKDAKNS